MNFSAFSSSGGKNPANRCQPSLAQSSYFLTQAFFFYQRKGRKKWLIKEMTLQIIFFRTLYTTLWNDFVKLNLISRTASPQTVIHLVSLRCWQYDIINLLQAFYCCYIFTFGLHGDHENSFSALTISQLSSKCRRVEVRAEMHFHTFHMSKSWRVTVQQSMW